MVTENHMFEENQSLRRDKNRAILLGAEVMQSARTPALAAEPPASKERLSPFWQVFGGTILSVVALVVITAYNQITSTQTDLRRELNQVQAELVRKDELNARLTAVWNSVKELQATNASLVSLNERANNLSHSLDAQNKSDEEERKDLQRQLGDLNLRMQALAERVAAIEPSKR